jgi:predicted permease
MISLTHGFHLGNLHTIFGSITLVFVLVSFGVISGLKHIRKEAKPRVLVAHRIFGWITMPLMLFTIILGLRLVGIL